MRLQIPKYEMLTGSHKFNIASTKLWINWWVKCISGAKMVGIDNVVIEVVLSDSGGAKLQRNA